MIKKSKKFTKKNNKSIFKKLVICFFFVTIIGFVTFFYAKNNLWNQTLPTSNTQDSNLIEYNEYNSDDNDIDENESFNFIKKGDKTFLDSGLLLLYGGILLIIISILGIFFTLKPKKKKNKVAKRNR